MSVPYIATFMKNGSPIGSTTGMLEGGNLKEEVERLISYFEGDTLAIKSMGISNWNSLMITADGQQFTASR
jgi:hypothetical protein